ncbi:helix-turn-helix transcriptional regulator [Streptomyces sp. SID5643]|uniref:response regulator transcription factor n=1 Tax=Streptomyces sp. SID5643 TaxID=2690307 RepID=UPI0031FE4F97
MQVCKTGNLSPREREILNCLASGFTYDQTARYLGISVHTVSTHLRRMRAKTSTSSLAALIRVSITEIDPPGFADARESHR